MNSNNSDYFDFSTKDELPEEYSKDMRKCPHCDKPIPGDSLFCLYCSQPVTPGKKNILVVLMIFLVLIAFVLWVLVL